jgi:hypothetical protein
MAADNDSIKVSTSINIQQDELIRAKTTAQPFSVNQHCHDEPPNINSPPEEAAAVNNDKCPMASNRHSSEGATVQTELLGTNSGLIGTVQGHAVVWSFWGKSGCEQQCPFPINGGHHRSSGEAPPDTESMQILIWCHVNKCKSPSSTRTRVAAVAFVDKQNEFNVHSMKHHRTKHKMYLNTQQKKTKQDENIKDVSIHKCCSSLRLLLEYITKKIVICDGGQYMHTVKEE